MFNIIINFVLTVEKYLCHLRRAGSSPVIQGRVGPSKVECMSEFLVTKSSNVEIVIQNLVKSKFSKLQKL